jgi:hypothetical protein
MTPGTLLPTSQFSGYVGGSLGDGRTSYFVSYDQYGIDRQRLLADLATQVGVGNTGLLRDANTLTVSAFSARMDHHFSAHDAANIRFSHTEMHGNALAAGKDALLPVSASGLNVTQSRLSAANAVDLSANTVNETRVQTIWTGTQVPAGESAIGLQAAQPTERRNRVFEAADNVYRQVGGQSLRMGGDFLYNQMNISFLEQKMGRMEANGPSISQSGLDAGLYVQGQRQLKPNLSMTTGMRYDLQSLRGMDKDLNNLSPQLGFAWSPGPSKTVIRAGFGMNYDRIPLPAFAGVADPDSGAVNLAHSATVRNQGSVSLGSLGDFTALDPSTQNSYAQNASVEVEQQMGKRNFLTAQYQWVRGVQLPLPVARTASLCSSSNACGVRNQITGQQVGSGSVSGYSGLTLAFTQQPVRWGSYKVAYTQSTAEGTGTGSNTSNVEDNMRRVSLTGTLHTSLDSGSTFWQHLSHGFLLSGTSDYLNRSEFLGMDFIHFNARLTKSLAIGQTFRLDGFVESYNSMQRTNASLVKAATAMGESARDVFAAYKAVASTQSPEGLHAGLRMSF